MDQEAEAEVSQVSMEDLPTEMLQMVFNNLDVSSLFACHVVSKKWNELANYILHDRPEAELPFKFNPSNKKYKLIVQNEENEMEDGKSIQDFLLEFVNQSENSRSSPFARFALINIQKWDETISNFLSAVSPTATCLKLKFSRSAMTDPRFTEKLRNLLLHETPKLKEFGLGFERKKPVVLKLALFPSPPKDNSTEENSNTNDQTLVKLAKLKVLQIGHGYEDDSTAEMFRDILRIAPNLDKIQPLVYDPTDYMQSEFCGFETFIFFLEYGKWNLLKHVSFNPTPNLLSDWKNLLQTKKISTKEISSLFKIEDLQLVFDKLPHTKNPNELREALHLVQQFLEGSKNTLRTLYIFEFDLGFPPGFSFPTFTRLSTIEFGAELEVKASPIVSNSMFPAGCRSLDIFPKVKTLDLGEFSKNLKYFFPREDSTPVMPSVHTISFEAAETSGEDVEIMGLLCPNVKKIKHVNIFDKNEDDVHSRGVGIDDFPSFGLAVWKNMKNLESLHLIIDADAETNEFPALDSTLTGISKENCLRLFEESTNADVENLDDGDETSAKLRRESELKGLKVNESIVDLPKLKELNLRIENRYDYVHGEFDAATFKPCIDEGLSRLSRVSQLYALKLISGLKYEITGEAYFC